MEAERLLRGAEAFVEDYTSDRILKQLQALEGAFLQTIQAPSAETASVFDVAVRELVNVARSGTCAQLSPSGQAILQRLGVAELCGEGLASAIETVPSSGTSPAAAVERLQSLRTRAKAAFDTLSSLRLAMHELGIDASHPPAEEAEVEVRLPGQIFGSNLGGFAIEAKRLDNALRDVVEVVSGSRPALGIRGFSTGSVEIFITVEPGAGLALLMLANQILTLINNIMQNRKLRVELERQGAPTQQIAEWEEKKVENELKRLRDALLKESPLDGPRKNELKGPLSKSLEYLAHRIDNGMDLSVAAEIEPPKPAEDEPDGGGAQPPEPDTPVRMAQRDIIEAMQKRALLPPRGPDPVLALPAPLAEDDEEQGGDAKEAKAGAKRKSS